MTCGFVPIGKLRIKLGEILILSLFYSLLGTKAVLVCMTFLQTLYSNSLGQIWLRGYLSDPISIAFTTRQGCPFSPLLFIIAIETLTIAIWAHPDILGVDSRYKQHKCALFPDDLLFLTSPHTSLPITHWSLARFWNISGLGEVWSSTSTYLDTFYRVWKTNIVSFSRQFPCLI